MCDINDLRSILRRTQGSNGVRRRAIVFLIRLVLEKEMDRLWEVAFSDIRKENRYADRQFPCLVQLMRDGNIAMDSRPCRPARRRRLKQLMRDDYIAMAEGIRFAWATLSDMCHYEEYDLTPTFLELDPLIDQVEGLLEDLRTFHDNHTEEK